MAYGEWVDEDGKKSSHIPASLNLDLGPNEAISSSRS